jgi:hypothetical protein
VEVASDSTQTAQPSAAITPDTGESPTAWLDALNRYRAAVQVRPVAEDAALTHADSMHVQYLFTNYGEAIARGAVLGAEMHQEMAGNPGYSEEGLNAAHHSDVVYEWLQGAPAGWAIEWWMAAPFHRPSLLNPFLERVGYASQCRDKVCLATLDAASGLIPMPPKPFEKPLLFPPDGGRIHLRRLSGNEWPNPLAPCSGFNGAAGIPITLMVGFHVPANLSRYSIEEVSGPNPGKLEVCGYDFNTYNNSDAGSLSKARGVMKSFGEVVVIPRNPLDAGATFHVVLTVNDKDYEWTFAVDPEHPAN